jgi:hypothetical protein
MKLRYSLIQVDDLWKVDHAADTGLTGRKIMVDTYGGLHPHGGGAFSGKDPTKVDRSGAYMARAIAKNIIRCGFAKRCQVAISYAIGKADPVALEIDTFGTGTVEESILCRAVLDVFNLKTCSHYRKAKADGCHLCRYSYLRPFQIWLKHVGVFRLLYRTKGGGKQGMLIEKKNTKDLIPATYNPRKDLKPGDAEYDKLKRSIEQFGYVEPVIWNKVTGHVVGGHQRLKVLIDMGITEVECVIIEMDEEKKKHSTSLSIKSAVIGTRINWPF